MSQRFPPIQALTLYLLFFLVSCTPEIDIDETSFKSAQAELSKVGQNLQVIFDASSGTASVELKSNKGWEAEFINGRASWCTLSSESGKRGTVVLTISVSENNTYEERSASIAFTYQDVKQTVVVVQKQNDAVLLSSSKLEVSATGGDFTFQVQNNIPFSAEVDAADKLWIQILGTKALTTSNVSIQVAENEEVAKRSGKIYIKSSKGQETINVYQDGAEPVLVLTQNKFNFTEAGGTFDVEIKSNLNYEYEIVAGSVWISEDKTKSVSTHTLHFNVKANETYDERTGMIRFYDKGTGTEETVTVFQKQKDALLITQNEYSITEAGDYITVEVKSNVDFEFEVVAGEEWIFNIYTKGLSTHNIQFYISRNDSYEDRTGIIRFYDKESGLEETVTVFQQQNEGVLINPGYFDVPAEGGIISLEVRSNVPYEYEIYDESKKWISEIQTKGLSSPITLQFEVQANESYYDRNGMISFRNIKTGFTTGVTIHQGHGEFIKLEQVEYTIPNKGDWFYITVQSTVEFEHEIIEGADWIEDLAPSQKGYVGNNSFRFAINRNETDKERVGKVRFFNEEKEMEAVATVIQDQKNTLQLDQTEFTVSSEEGIFTLDLKTNAASVYCQIYQGGEWISEITTKTLEPYSLQFQVKENKSSIPRVARMMLAGYECDETKDIVITQAGKPNDRNALMAIYNACGGANWTRNDNWGSESPISEWYGVSLNKEGRVDAINLPFNNVSGNLPDAMTQLEALRIFNVEGASFTSFPEVLCHCENLEEIFINESYQMKGKIPESIGNLKKLKLLHLWGTGLSGDLPKAIYTMDCWRYAYSDIITHNNIKVDWQNNYFRAPEFSVTDISGKRYNSSELYSQNRYTILYAPCVEEGNNNPYMNEMKHLYSIYGNKDVSIISFPINLDYLRGIPIREYVQKYDIKWPCIDLGHDRLNFYETPDISISGYPCLGGSQIFHSHYIVVDRGGNVVYAKFGSLYWRRYSEGGGGNVGGNYDENTRLSCPGNVMAVIEEDLYQSKDYSMDKVVARLQTCTEGNGVDVVVMGDGYSDRMISNGSYMEDMKLAVEYLFRLEPLTSLRHLFNITAINAVSKNEVFDSSAETVFKTRVSTGVLYSDGKNTIREYAVKALGDAKRAEKAHIIVVVNNTGGTSVCYMGDQSISLVVAGSRSYATFGTSVIHEAGGHGIGHLGDEYGPESAEVLSRFLPEYHRKWWFRNVDITNDPDKIVWNKMLSDDRYSGMTGIYEVIPGVYIPSQNSIMNNDWTWFNGPSREAIFYHVHKIAFGDEWVYDFEDFAEFDKKVGYGMYSTTKASAVPTVDMRKLTAPPILPENDR